MPQPSAAILVILDDLEVAGMLNPYFPVEYRDRSAVERVPDGLQPSPSFFLIIEPI